MRQLVGRTLQFRVAEPLVALNDRHRTWPRLRLCREAGTDQALARILGLRGIETMHQLVALGGRKNGHRISA
ncbi:hypothetical protein CPBF367_39510 [Xanthomonas arboricola pv. juglandis]|nr:hypothetical protein CPBF367_39510 [Xanthomonas arboricola pv. juglandis]